MPAWSLVAVGAEGSGDWFAQRFFDAKAAVPDAEFDTIIPQDFGETITSELVDVVGVATADVASVNGGAIQVNAGDLVITPSSARLQMTGTPAHVSNLGTKRWYMASLVRYLQPVLEADIAETRCDCIALWNSDGNSVGLGVMGNASGGSTTKWVAHINNASSMSNVLGPDLDGESPVYHLFESWNDGTLVHFRLDGTEFDDTLPASDLPTLSAALGCVFQRTAVGDDLAVIFEKMCVVVKSPAPGGID